MNKYAKTFVAVVAFAFLLDVATFGIMAFTVGMQAEANPIKVLFGDRAIAFAIALSFIAAFILYKLINRAETKFRKGLIAIAAANIVYTKIVASAFNLFATLSAEPQEIYLPNELLASYFLTMVLLLFSPIVFNLLFYWIWWNWFKDWRRLKELGKM